MNVSLLLPQDLARLHFLIKIAKRELQHLEYSQSQVFFEAFTREKAKNLIQNEPLAEKLEAFVSRFCRLQDTLGDKLLPALLKILQEPIGANLDNLNRAEKLGILPSAENWIVYRNLRNKMIHEYIEDMDILAQALNQANKAVGELKVVLQNVIDKLNALEGTSISS